MRKVPRRTSLSIKRVVWECSTSIRSHSPQKQWALYLPFPSPCARKISSPLPWLQFCPRSFSASASNFPFSLTFFCCLLPSLMSRTCNELLSWRRRRGLHCDPEFRVDAARRALERVISHSDWWMCQPSGLSSWSVATLLLYQWI